MPGDGKLAAPPALPDLASLTRITVSDSSQRTVVTVDDEMRLAEVLRWLESLDSGWVPPWDSMPSPSYTLTLETNRGTKTVLWFGDGWIGTEGVLRHLHTPERAKIGDLLGLPAGRDEAPPR